MPLLLNSMPAFSRGNGFLSMERSAFTALLGKGRGTGDSRVLGPFTNGMGSPLPPVLSQVPLGQEVGMVTLVLSCCSPQETSPDTHESFWECIRVTSSPCTSPGLQAKGWLTLWARQKWLMSVTALLLLLFQVLVKKQ